MNKFGEIFHDGKMISLENSKNTDLNTVVTELKNIQKKLKCDIDVCLEKMKKYEVGK